MVSRFPDAYISRYLLDIKANKSALSLSSFTTTKVALIVLSQFSLATSQLTSSAWTDTHLVPTKTQGSKQSEKNYIIPYLPDNN